MVLPGLIRGLIGGLIRRTRTELEKRGAREKGLQQVNIFNQRYEYLEEGSQKPAERLFAAFSH